MDNIQLKIKFLSTTDPYEVVGVDMDGFSPYLTFNIDDEFDEIRDWIEGEYIQILQDQGVGEINKLLTKLKMTLTTTK